MEKPRVFVDFHNADVQGHLRLNCTGTLTDLANQKIRLRLHDGKKLTLYSEDLEVEGIVKYSTEENLWVAVIDWDKIVEKQANLFPQSRELEIPTSSG
ncbi:MAG: hypothetical protein KME64_27470 [Scytonematopsis contorta HA4267-MV1]|jgi:hypothetical protein|nr:hypothetical protein [Scytonematopsis contorta HA4267-MV1]